MSETPEMIRKQMQQTKLRLAMKLQSLEQQVSTTVRSTETAVNATMDAVGTVAGAVHNSVDSVANLLDVSQQVEKHPWLFVGGAVFVGYLAAEFFTTPSSENVSVSDAVPNPATNQQHRSTVDVPLAHGESNVIGHPLDTASSPWHQLKDAVIGSLNCLAAQTLSRIVPLVVDKIFDQWNQPAHDSSITSSGSCVSTEPSAFEAHRLRIAHSGTTRSRIF